MNIADKKYVSLIDSTPFFLQVKPAVENRGFSDVTYTWNDKYNCITSDRDHREKNGKPYQFRVDVEEVNFKGETFICATLMYGLINSDDEKWDIEDIIGKFFYKDNKWTFNPVMQEYIESIPRNQSEYMKYGRMTIDSTDVE